MSSTINGIRSKLQSSEDMIDELQQNASQLNSTIINTENSVHIAELSANDSNRSIDIINSRGKSCLVCSVISATSDI